MRQTLISMVRDAWPKHQSAAEDALKLFRSYCSQPMRRIPGMDTVLRIAVRINAGNSIEQAGAREYAYRWHLALNQWINHAESRSRSRPVTGAWQAPHIIGM